ncbi:hypothetical protein M2350_003541 [Candidatus Fervidibacter sacchari]|uniref:Uncharacterized protein n=1 Tax=Candidatus Fervidibacter sacchari TaxID=1448929 RepID=A0ABT2EW12_9BACT|nr:hypothetical protein [Candidatus Fervidibacter sacchari]
MNEPKEYRIVRIVKKRRWQVCLEALRSCLALSTQEKR